MDDESHPRLFCLFLGIFQNLAKSYEDWCPSVEQKEPVMGHYFIDIERPQGIHPLKTHYYQNIIQGNFTPIPWAGIVKNGE